MCVTRCAAYHVATAKRVTLGRIAISCRQVSCLRQAVNVEHLRFQYSVITSVLATMRLPYELCCGILLSTIGTPSEEYKGRELTISESIPGTSILHCALIVLDMGVVQNSISYKRSQIKIFFFS